MMLTSRAGVPASPMRLLEMLSDRFGLFEALAYSTIKLNRCTQADELAMDPLVAEAVLEFGDDLRSARAAADEWAMSKGIAPRADAEGRVATMQTETAAGDNHPPAAVPHLARRFTCCGRETLRRARRMPSSDALQPIVLIRLDIRPFPLSNPDRPSSGVPVSERLQCTSLRISGQQAYRGVGLACT
ncbi:MAG TPA: hypothetical protein VEY93_02050 [Longimicrobium sp.]|nr:hypothetical protein [Longimicrobium sp.]